MKRVNLGWMEEIMRLSAHLSAITVFLAAIALPQLVVADTGFTPHSAEYRVKFSFVSGRLRTELEETETGYKATHRVQPTGFVKLFANGAIEETSSFTVTDDGVLPVHYVSHDTLSKNPTHAVVDFDWSKRRMSGAVNDLQVIEELETFVRDRVSIQYQLMLDLLQDGGSGRYVFFDIDKFKTANVRVVGTKQVKVPAGRFEVVGVAHQSENSSRVTTLWCAKELGFLPVIIEQHRKGKLRLRATLRKYTPAATDQE
jgi:hypothetical protein